MESRFRESLLWRYCIGDRLSEHRRKIYSDNKQGIYKIKGTNPTETSLKNYIGTDPWYTQRIAKKESSYRQFDSNNMPLASSDGKGGYGVFQITPPGADIRFWSWKANVDRGKEIIAEKKSITDTFTNSQINQWTAWNAIHDPDVSEPTKTIYSGITFSLYPSGAEKSYHDANTIKFYNGLGGVEPISHFLVWKNNEPPYDSRPGWLIREYAEYYVSEGKTTKIYYVRLICETIP